ncbi:MAG TPA: bifunctional phosphopantothenoylcysteine decarboxylase/phosphopantothenate--cysteine ligase CoaBC [Vicinamibacterales bacterium]|nr:bifunctional phosphopantothenoylcysteine decarboxylase/phosphopantothenate--cysteine ligase CoaBC [Vicinamibacterales bacterium]
MARVALGITGGIGAYKAVEVARGLQKRGHDVVAVMTRNARRFVGPVTLEAITRHPVVTSQWTSGANADVEHISLASSIDLLLVAPATANILGKFAGGIADDFLSALYLATTAPVLVAPAMNTNMLEHPAVRQNLRTLEARGVRFVQPGAGYLACGWIGKGRLAEPEDIVEAADLVLRGSQSLAGLRVLVTAGPTYEDLDPVRFIGNRSSGRMGFALAREAARRGAAVTLVAGPTSVEPPQEAELVRVRSAAEMHDAVMARVDTADIVVMAAAVADYAPESRDDRKKAKSDDGVTLTLRRTPDILAGIGAWRSAQGRARPVLVGFAAETDDGVAKGRRKLVSKHADFVVVNDVLEPGAGFEVETNVVTLVGPDWEEALPLQPKSSVAAVILDRAERLIAQAAGGPA